MAATITQSVNDNHKSVEDKVRDLVANQGKNDNALWLLIDAEIAQSLADGKLIENYKPNNKHGNK